MRLDVDGRLVCVDCLDACRQKPLPKLVAHRGIPHYHTPLARGVTSGWHVHWPADRAGCHIICQELMDEAGSEGESIRMHCRNLNLLD